MLILPHGRDQNDNAARVTARGAGLSLPPEASVEQIRSALRRLIEEPAFSESAARLGAAIKKGQEYLLKQQKVPGRWEPDDKRVGEGHAWEKFQGASWGGYTSIATYVTRFVPTAESLDRVEDRVLRHRHALLDVLVGENPCAGRDLAEQRRHDERARGATPHRLRAGGRRHVVGVRHLPAQPAVPELPPAEAQHRFCEACAAAWQQLTTGSFDAVVLDDWHLADDASRTLLGFIAAYYRGWLDTVIRGARILLGIGGKQRNQLRQVTLPGRSQLEPGRGEPEPEERPQVL